MILDKDALEENIERVKACIEDEAYYKYGNSIYKIVGYEVGGKDEYDIKIYLEDTEDAEGATWARTYSEWIDMEYVDIDARFDDSVGCHYSQSYLDDLSDEELAEKIRDLPEWDADLLRELCYRGGTLKEFIVSSYPDCPAIYKAAEKLGIEID